MSDANARPLRIVVFDDNAADVHLLAEALAENRMAFDLDVFDDGEQVHKYLASQKPQADLFVIDLNLPKLTGDEILFHIRQDKSLSHIPALVLTSSDSVRDRERVMQLGATAFLRKPCTLDEYFGIGKVIKNLILREPPASAGGRSGEASETP